jgi:hypothetical protein
MLKVHQPRAFEARAVVMQAKGEARFSSEPGKNAKNANFGGWGTLYK